MLIDFVRVLQQKIRTDIENFKGDMAAGQCKSFEHYSHLCGVIQGLTYAERHLTDLAKAATQEDED